MSKKEFLENGLREMSKSELIAFSLAQYDVYTDLLQGYEETSELLMNSGLYIFEMISFLTVHLPEDTDPRKKMKGVLLKFFSDLHKNDKIRHYNNLNNHKRNEKL